MESEQEDTVQVIAEKAVSIFELGHLVGFTPIQPCFRNQSFSLHTDQGRFLLRIHQKTKTDDDILLEEHIVQHAEDRGVTVPKSLGTFLHEDRKVSVQEWISGETLSTIPLTPKLAYQSGVLLATIHKSLVDFVPSVASTERHNKPIEDRLAEQIVCGDDKAEVIFKLLSQIENADEYREAIEHFLHLSAQLQQHARNAILGYMLQPQYLHGDFNPRNIIPAKPNWVVLDWEDSFLGTPTFDIAKALLYLCGFPEKDPNQTISRSFLSGYKALANINKDELAGILWEARFVIALDLNWLLVSLYYRDLRRLSFLHLDSNRIERLLVLEAADWFSPTHVRDFYKRF